MLTDNRTNRFTQAVLAGPSVGKSQVYMIIMGNPEKSLVIWGDSWPFMVWTMAIV